MKDRPSPGDPDAASTDTAGRVPSHPATDASAMRKLGSEAGDTERMNISGHDRQGTSEPGSVGAAAEDAYWRRTFGDRDYVDPERGYEYYRPAYRYGWEAGDPQTDRPFEEVESELRNGWEADLMGLEWEQARPAVRDAFEKRSSTAWSDPGNPLE